ncbi:hypothetical protein LMG23994_03355 [Cupriavidus pinatubonensis]|uniref:Uncharacterized protein n=1 Tax=Cupriavidus pinatubonensis TaxID=248026 RepID=A0ABM8X8M4_9BURK|nr:hypothetical protein LMG23994_03355 [Cupriavidus pinatubonensis]
MSLPLSNAASRDAIRCVTLSRVTRVPGYAAFRKLLLQLLRSVRVSPVLCHAVSSSRGMESDMASRLMSQMNPLSSRATATTAMFFSLPRATSLR